MKITSESHARKLVELCYCKECGNLRVATPSGGTCPDHRIQPGLSADEIDKAPEAKRLLNCPQARWWARGQYVHNGVLYERCIKRPHEIKAAAMIGSKESREYAEIGLRKVRSKKAQAEFASRAHEIVGAR